MRIQKKSKTEVVNHRRLEGRQCPGHKLKRLEESLWAKDIEFYFLQVENEMSMGHAA